MCFYRFAASIRAGCDVAAEKSGETRDERFVDRNIFKCCACWLQLGLSDPVRGQKMGKRFKRPEMLRCIYFQILCAFLRVATWMLTTTQYSTCCSARKLLLACMRA
jgi:hypothetical protein